MIVADLSVHTQIGYLYLLAEIGSPQDGVTRGGGIDKGIGPESNSLSALQRPHFTTSWV